MKEKNLTELINNYDIKDITQFLIDYNSWITKQLEVGGLIFSPEDYFGIWQGRV